MTKKQRRRLAFVAAVLIASAGVAGLSLTALKDNVRYFYSPSDIAATHIDPGIAIRIGGLVSPGSFHRGGGAEVRFAITDGAKSIPIAYRGVLPGLFREGQGIVATGALDSAGSFQASELLAKHDEKYMPPEVVDALKRSGHWNEAANDNGKTVH